MLTGQIPVNPIRTSVPAGTGPAATLVNPDSPKTQDRPETARAVNRSEKAENPNTDQTREKNTQVTSEPNLQPAEQRVLDQLRSRDRAVRAHEQAHLTAAGNLASGGASFSYQRGPDGKRYAIGGEVGLASVKVPGDPEATIKRAQQVRRAALAPVNPSAQDRSVAVNATVTEQKAQVELAKLQQAERGESATAAFNDVVASSATENQDDATKQDLPTPIDTFA